MNPHTAIAKARRERRRANGVFIARLKRLAKGQGIASGVKNDPGASLEAGRGNKTPVRKRKNRVPARKRAFLDLKAACKAFVFARNRALNGGLCEIALACGGAEEADTWYHGWPQKGGNGLKYEVRSHFASCSRCNMGEFGARYRGDKRYENRHREILGDPLYNVLAERHGRKEIGTVEARELAAEIRRRTEAREWGVEADTLRQGITEPK